MFYTFEGFTKSPAGHEVENCQLLGRENGADVYQAREKFIVKNSWIEEYGFNIDNIIAVQVVGVPESNYGPDLPF